MTDPLAGYIHTNLGVLDLVAGDFETALGHLGPVASGEVAAVAAHRVMAMVRVAWIWHHQGERLRAYRAYRQIAAFSARADVRARCEVECVGLLLELAESGKGTHEEVRDEARRVFTRTPRDTPALVRRASTLELMFGETYSRQPRPNHRLAARLMDDFVARYGALGEEQPVREVATAHYQAGLYYYRARDLSTAYDRFSAVFGLYPLDVPQFAGLNPHAEAILGWSNIAWDEGDQALAREMLVELLRLYPGEQSAERVRRLFPALQAEAEARGLRPGRSGKGRRAASRTPPRGWRAAFLATFPLAIHLPAPTLTPC